MVILPTALMLTGFLYGTAEQIPDVSYQYGIREEEKVAANSVYSSYPVRAPYDVAVEGVGTVGRDLKVHMQMYIRVFIRIP